MTTEPRRPTIRKSISFTIIAIGALMALAGVVTSFAMKDGKPVGLLIGSATFLIVSGYMSYARRTSEEKRLLVPRNDKEPNQH